MAYWRQLAQIGGRCRVLAKSQLQKFTCYPSPGRYNDVLYRVEPTSDCMSLLSPSLILDLIKEADKMTQLMKTPAQGLLFDEPFYSETGVWCELADGIDPTRWAHLCRHLGTLTPEQFKRAEKRLYPDPDSLKIRLKRLFCFDQHEAVGFSGDPDRLLALAFTTENS
jgi:hypothetical protein